MKCVLVVYFGGKDSGVSEKTTNIFIESALFNPTFIRKTAKHYGLNTDASFRYERGVDCKMVMPALNKAIELVIKICGGEVASKIYDIYPNKEADYRFNINFDNIRKTGGFKIPNNEIKRIFKFS